MIFTASELEAEIQYIHAWYFLTINSSVIDLIYFQVLQLNNGQAIQIANGQTLQQVSNSNVQQQPVIMQAVSTGSHHNNQVITNSHEMTLDSSNGISEGRGWWPLQNELHLCSPDI